MKHYVSYVVQGPKNHTHHGEVVDLKGPPYNYSHDPEMPFVMDWSERKQKELSPDQHLVVMNVFKI